MISQKTPKAAPKVAFAIMIAINVVICALKRARGASANGLVCLLRSVSLLQAGAGMGELHVGAFRTVPVPIAESLEKIRAEIASVEATQDVVDSPGHDDIVSFKHAEIIIAPSGIRGNPAVGGHIKLRTNMEFIFLSMDHDNVPRRNSLGTQQ